MGRVDAAHDDLMVGLALAMQIPVGAVDRSILLCEVNLALTTLFIQRKRYGMAWRRRYERMRWRRTAHMHLRRDTQTVP